jgi:hypothetical protein
MVKERRKMELSWLAHATIIDVPKRLNELLQDTDAPGVAMGAVCGPDV